MHGVESKLGTMRPLPFHKRAGAEAERHVERAAQHGDNHVRAHPEASALEVRLYGGVHGGRCQGRRILHLRLRDGVLLLRPRSAGRLARRHSARRRGPQRRRRGLGGLQPRRARRPRHAHSSPPSRVPLSLARAPNSSPKAANLVQTQCARAQLRALLHSLPVLSPWNWISRCSSAVIASD